MIGSRYKIRIKGLNQERAINAISKNIKIYNFKKENENISQFEVDYKNHRKLKKLVQAHGMQVISSSGRGIKHFVKRILKSYGIAVALLLIVLCYAVQYNFIFKIHVFGQEKGQNAQIERFVDDSLKSRIKGQINTKQMENAILEKFDFVSSASVAIVGQSLVVNINQVVIPQEMEDGQSALISEFDGRISSISLVQGTLAVEVGDIVKKGDVLVYPYIIDSQGERRETEARAEIIADVWMQASVSHYDCLYKRERTGRKISYNEIYLNNLLVFSGERHIPFEKYEIETSKAQLNQNLILPLIKKTIDVYETHDVEIRQNFSEKKDEIIQNARQKALIFLKENDIIKEEIYSIKEESGWHEVTYVLTVSRNIGG